MRKKKRSAVKITILVIVVLVAVALGAFAYYLYDKVNSGLFSRIRRSTAMMYPGRHARKCC
ncbi:MAG: hypothetical protein ACLTSZ_09165 [Lachnospiraceae bacterium]